MQRTPDVDETYWSTEGSSAAASVLSMDVEDPKNLESLFGITTLCDDGKYPMMDCRHLEVYAKATRTRIVLLHFWGSIGQSSGPSNSKFTCLDIDWQGPSAAKVKFTVGIPDFGDDYDFYRTAVIMNGPTCRKVSRDDLIGNGT
jgi:hypothetical protein